MRHRGDHELDVVVAVAERALELGERLARDRRWRVRGVGLVAELDRRELEHVPVEPLAIREPARDVALELGVVDDAALRGVDDEHHPGGEPALLPDLLGRHVDHARLGREDDAIVGRDRPPRGPQAVAISVAPTSWPSLNTIAAGPSHGSTSDAA